jgi:hypothetical protein
MLGAAAGEKACVAELVQRKSEGCAHRVRGWVVSEFFDAAVEVAAVDEIDDFDAVGVEAEEEAVIAADADAEHVRGGAQAHDAGEGGGFRRRRCGR